MGLYVLTEKDLIGGKVVDSIVTGSITIEKNGRRFHVWGAYGHDLSIVEEKKL